MSIVSNHSKSWGTNPQQFKAGYWSKTASCCFTHQSQVGELLKSKWDASGSELAILDRPSFLAKDPISSCADVHVKPPLEVGFVSIEKRGQILIEKLAHSFLEFPF